ncbi:MAG TPA: trypsin-like peptidase domain-containing protein, partial [Acidothermaceae bacterium]
MTDEHTGEGRPAVEGDLAGSESTAPESAAPESTAPDNPWWAAPATPSPAPPSYAPPPVYDSPAYNPAPAYDAPSSNPPPAYSPAPAYDPPSAYSPAPAYDPPSAYSAAPAYSPAPAYDPPSAYEAAPASYHPTVPYLGGTPASTPFAVPPGTLPPGGYDRDSGRRRLGWGALLVVAVVAALVGAAVAGGIVAANKKTASTTPVTNSASTSASASASTVNASSPAGTPTAAAVQGGNESVAQIAKALLPSVVSIIVTSGTSGDEGTGIVLTADGNILTNNHVVEGAATSGTIAVTINDGRTVKATIVGRDPTTDLAVIKAAGVTDLHPATLGQDSSLVVGQQVIAIGSPLGLSNTVTSGIVSSLNRPVCTQNCDGTGGTSSATPTVLDAIQTDAAINPG